MTASDVLHAAVVALAAVSLAGLVSTAQAEREPPERTARGTPARPPGLTLARQTVAVHSALEVSLARDAPFAPASLAVDLSVGVTDDFSVGIVHSSAALTGFRGSAGAGFCLSREGCAARYSGGGVELLWGLSRGTFSLAANAGLLATMHDPPRTDAKLGVKLRLGRGPVYLLASPSVWLVIDHLGDPAMPHESQLWAPVSAWVKLGPLAIGAASGIKGPLGELRTRCTVPLGGLAQVAAGKRASFGASFVFGKLAACDDRMAPGTATRAAQVWMTVASG